MIDLRDFRTVCYRSAEQTGGRVVEFRVATGVTPNFHQGIVAYRDHRVAVVCTRERKFLAVAEPRVIELVDRSCDSGPLMFIDAPDLVSALGQWPGFRVLDAAELNGVFDPTAWPGSDPHDLRYWKPATLGEALFNYWD